MEEVANKGDLAAIDEWMAPDIVEHEEMPPEAPSGRSAMRCGRGCTGASSWACRPAAGV